MTTETSKLTKIQAAALEYYRTQADAAAMAADPWADTKVFRAAGGRTNVPTYNTSMALVAKGLLRQNTEHAWLGFSLAD